MKALRYENKHLVVGETALPNAAGEALVRVTMSGICNTDIEIVRGYAGFEGTIGHEFVGVVEEATAAPYLAGQRVVGEINAGCGTCPLCISGDPRHCPTRTVLGIVGRDGAHAEFLTLPVVNLLPVSDDISDEVAVFAEPLAAAWGITERVHIDKETRVAVIGDGKLGLLCAQTLALASANVLLIGKHQEKLRIAAARGIEATTANGIAHRERTFDVVVEASGGEAGFALALDLVRPKGTLILKSTFQGLTEINSARIVVDEISIVGSRCGRFAPALDLLKNKSIDVKNMISDEYSLVDGVRAIDRASERGVLKVLLRM